MPTKATGGYMVTLHVPLVRTRFCAHTAALDKPVSDLSIHALNVVQATSWRVNTWVLDVIQEAFTRGIPLPGLEVEAMPPVPVRLDDKLWAAMSKDERKKHMKKRQDVYDKRAGIKGRHYALMECLTVTERVRSAERIWFPHTTDFRGRIYPIPMSGPHPQGDDMARALIHFADGMPLGPDASTGCASVRRTLSVWTSCHLRSACNGRWIIRRIYQQRSRTR
jgi:DNA-directed RNA polymerase